MQCCSSPESHERVRCIGLPCWIRNQDRRGPKSRRECTPTRTAWSEAHESLTLNSIPVFYMARADVRVTKSRGLRRAGFFNDLHWTIRPDTALARSSMNARFHRTHGADEAARNNPTKNQFCWVCQALRYWRSRCNAVDTTYTAPKCLSKSKNFQQDEPFRGRDGGKGP